MRKLSKIENLRLGFNYLTRYHQVRNFPYLSADEIRACQFTRIKKLINLAYNHTEFYRNKYTNFGIYPEDIKTWDDFNKLPTTTKDELVAYHNQVIVSGKQNSNNLIESRSSGSSGKVINIMMDGNFFIDEALITLRMFQHSFDYKLFDKQTLIYTSEYPYQSILGLYKAIYIYTLTPIDKIIEFLIKQKPDFIVSYPSVLLEIIQKLTDEDYQQIKPKAISTNSEHSSQHQRDYIASVFKCPVFDEYSSEELSRIAFQCSKKSYHLQEDCSYIEILNPENDGSLPDNTTGEIVGTCLLNNIMPFIRYRQGDLGSIAESHCTCSSHARVLKNIAGRKNLYFRLADGSQISSGKLLDWTYELMLTYKLPISQYQLVQKNYNDIELRVVLSRHVDQNEMQGIVQHSFINNFGNQLRIHLNIVNSIEKSEAGKHLPIMSLIRE